MLISVVTNPIASFIFIEGSMAEQAQDKYAQVVCARVILGNIRRKFSLKNAGFWNAYLLK